MLKADANTPLPEGAKIVLYTALDQTVGFITPDGAVSVLHHEAQFFDTYAQAMEARADEEDVYLQVVLDVVAFRAQPPEWMSRPVSMATVFELARAVHDMLGNEHLATEKFEVRGEAYLLQCAAEVFMKATGHKGAGGWVFGKAPSEASS